MGKDSHFNTNGELKLIIIPVEQLQDIVQQTVEACIGSQRSEPQPEADELLTVQQAAEFLNLTVPTIYSKASKGELPVMKRSKRLYFSRLELMGYLKAGRRKSNEEIEAAADAYLSNQKKG